MQVKCQILDWLCDKNKPSYWTQAGLRHMYSRGEGGGGEFPRNIGPPDPIFLDNPEGCSRKNTRPGNIREVLIFANFE